MGSPNDFCATTCEVCGYYREQVHGPIRVLVVSDSVSLRGELQRGATRRPVRFEFAAREYECASIVEAFQPEFALIDCSLPRQTWTSLASCMATDPRAAGIRIVLLTSKRSKRAIGVEPLLGDGLHAQLGMPLSWPELEVVVGLARTPLGPLPADKKRTRKARKATAA